MKHRLFLILCICFSCIYVYGEQEAGLALLDRMVVTFDELTACRTDDQMEEVQNALDGMMADARKAKAQGQIEADFYTRYTRILMVLKLVTTPDPQVILKEVIIREVVAFIQDTKGTKIDSKQIGNLIGPLAESMTLEISHLREQLEK